MVVNRLQDRLLPEDQRLPIDELVGHGLPEIVAGMAMALALATPLSLLLR